MLCCLRNQITSDNWNRRSGSKLLLGGINVCFYSYKLHVIVVIIKFRWLRGCATTSSVENNQLSLPRLFTVRKNIVERFRWWNKLRHYALPSPFVPVAWLKESLNYWGKKFTHRWRSKSFHRRSTDLAGKFRHTCSGVKMNSTRIQN